MNENKNFKDIAIHFNVLSALSKKALAEMTDEARKNLSGDFYKIDMGLICNDPIVVTSICTINGVPVVQYNFGRDFEILIYEQQIMIIAKDVIIYSPCENKVFWFSYYEIYKKWDNMIGRCCYSKTDNHKKNYQEKGISVCDEWRHDSKKFIKWAVLFGNYYAGSCIDRINNKFGYSPDNIRFVTNWESNIHRDNLELYTVFNDDKPVTIWAERIGCPSSLLYDILRNDGEDALIEFIRESLKDL